MKIFLLFEPFSNVPKCIFDHKNIGFSCKLTSGTLPVVAPSVISANL